jgi:hypothetical protein
MPGDTEKPRRKKGALCPFFKRDVSQVCHRCELYDVVRFNDPENPAAIREQWGCTFLLANTISKSLGAACEGTQMAVESFRNEMVRQNRALLEANGEIPDANLLIGGRR